MHRRPQQQQRYGEAVTTGGARRGAAGAMSSSRRGRFDYHYHDGGQGSDGPVATVPVVDQAGCTAQSCRSCVAVTLADAIALGCCPCALVSLLGLAFVKAPLAVARRCLRRLRRRHGELRQKKRVRDDVDPAAPNDKYRARGVLLPDADAWKGGGWIGFDTAAAADGGGRGSSAARRASTSSSSCRLDAEKVWMEMYRVGQWGFGRLSVSVSSPPPPPASAGDHVAPARSSDCDGHRKDLVLRCES